MNAEPMSVLHMIARETGRKYEDVYAEYHGTMKVWYDPELTAQKTAHIQKIRAERAEKKAKKTEIINHLAKIFYILNI